MEAAMSVIKGQMSPNKAANLFARSTIALVEEFFMAQSLDQSHASKPYPQPFQVYYDEYISV